jgi:hypothetical protein
MRHQQIAAQETYTKVNVQALWPASAQVAPLPIPDVEQKAEKPFEATPAAPDVPASVGGMIVASYATLLATFGLATLASAYSVYTFTICALFLVSFFTVPWLFFRQERSAGARPTLDRFMRNGMETLTGHSSGAAALVQMMIVPVMLTLGVIAMGIAAAIIM